MLSTENPPDPSCSCKVPPVVVKSDERPALVETDPAVLVENQPPHFSIRNYVFTSRSKDIGTSWPFPQQYLQLCLKHGVRDLLPPFEPPDLVRARQNTKIQQLVVSIDNGEKHTLEVDFVQKEASSTPLRAGSNDLKYTCILGTSDQACNSVPNDKLVVRKVGICDGGDDNKLARGEAENESTVTRHGYIERTLSPIDELPSLETRVVSETPKELKIAKVPSLPGKVQSVQEPSEKKVRLIVKLRPSPNISSDSSMVSDPMASKVCPICKTFSSSSNTTLNAHIDQCLSVESYDKHDFTETLKHKVKPRKKRLMVDIYTTAPRCTLEDLDRRNGSNWALDLTLVAPTNQVCSESKRPKLSPVDPLDDEIEEGAVYVDSNGTKLCILSKLNDLPPSTIGESCNTRRPGKEIKQARKFRLGKNRHVAPTHMKVNSNGKKLSSLNLPKVEIHVSLEGKCHTEGDQEKEATQPQSLIAQDQIKNNKPGILRQWARSKRSDLSKMKPVLRKSPSSMMIDAPPTTSGEACKPRRLEKDIKQGKKYLFSKKKRLAPTNSVKVKSHSKKLSSLRLLKDETQVASEGKFHMEADPEKETSPPKASTIKDHMQNGRPGILRHWARSKRSGPSRKNLCSRKDLFLGKSSLPCEPNECNGSQNRLVIRRFPKHRSMKENDKQRRHSSSDDDKDELHDTNFFDLDSQKVYYPRKTNLSKCLEDVMSDITQLLSEGNKMLYSEQGIEGSSEAGRGKYISLKRSVMGGVQDPEMPEVNLRTYSLPDIDTMITSSSEDTARAPATGEPVCSEDHVAIADATLNSWPSLKENEQLNDRTEVFAEQLGPRFFDPQGMHYENEDSTATICQNIRMSGQMEFRAKEYSGSEAQYMECLTETASVQGSSACLTNPGNTGFDISFENSVPTSIRTVANDDHAMVIDRELSGSPSSTISHPSIDDFRTENSEPQTVTKSFGIKETTRLEISESLESPSPASTKDTGRTNREKHIHKAASVAQETEEFMDNQRCFCSRKGNMHHGSQLFTKSNLGTISSANVKRMPSSLYAEQASTSYGAFPGMRTEVMGVPVLGSPVDSISLGAPSEVSARFNACSDFVSAERSPGTQFQSNSSHVLRLMGKNLMVANKEEDEQIHLQKALRFSSYDSSNAQYLSPGSSPDDSATNQSNCLCWNPQFIQGSMMMGQCLPPNTHQVPLPLSSQMGAFMGNPRLIEQKRTDCQSHLKALLDGKSCAASTSHPSYQTGEVIVIDDSPDVDVRLNGGLQSAASTLSHAPTFPGSNLRLRPFSCFPTQYPFQLRESPSGSTPWFPGFFLPGKFPLYSSRSLEKQQ